MRPWLLYPTVLATFAFGCNGVTVRHSEDLDVQAFREMRIDRLLPHYFVIGEADKYHTEVPPITDTILQRKGYSVQKLPDTLNYKGEEFKVGSPGTELEFAL